MMGSGRTIRKRPGDSSKASQHSWVTCVRLQTIQPLLMLLGVLAITLLNATFAVSLACAQAETLGESSQSADGWSPPAASSSAAPRLAIDLTQLNAFANTDLLRTTTVQPANGGVAELPPSAFNPLQIGGVTTGLHRAIPTLLSSPITPSTISLISLMDDNYNAWEATLAETHSPVDIDGVSVHQLIQLNYGSWHLPVAMYISTGRDHNAW